MAVIEFIKEMLRLRFLLMIIHTAAHQILKANIEFFKYYFTIEMHYKLFSHHVCNLSYCTIGPRFFAVKKEVRKKKSNSKVREENIAVVFIQQ